MRGQWVVKVSLCMGSWRGSVWVVGGLLAVAEAEGLPRGVGLVTDDPSIVASGRASLPVVTCDSKLGTTCQIIWQTVTPLPLVRMSKHFSQRQPLIDQNSDLLLVTIIL